MASTQKLLRKKKKEASCNSLNISDYARYGDLNQAFSLYEKMQEGGIFPCAYSLVTLLKSCTIHKDVKKGQKIHHDLSNKGLIQSNVFIGSTLINMYAKCGLVLEAEEVFNHLIVRNVVLWNALISGYVEYGYSEKVFQCLNQMRGEGIFPDAITLVCSLKACSSIGSIVKGEEIYAEVIHNQYLERDVFIGNALVDMYAKCGFLEKAEELFPNLPDRDIVSWNALISGYAEHGHGERAISCLDRMTDDGISPDAVTLVCGLKACGSIRNIPKGEEIHSDAMRKGFLETDAYIGSTLIYMYIRCGLLTTALYVFETVPYINIVTWNVLITGYLENGYNEEVLSCIGWMKAKGIYPDSVTFVCSLKACRSLGDLYNGRDRHGEIVRKGFDRDIYVRSTLVDMYAKCGSFEEADKVFDNRSDSIIVAWNALIGGYVEHGHNEKALRHFEEMLEEGTRWDIVTVVNGLKACGSIRAITKVQEIHARITKAGFPDRDSFIGSTLVDMYAKCDLFLEARYMFEKLIVQDEVSWTALLSGSMENGHIEEVLSYCEQMQCEGISQGAITTSIILKACGSTKAIEKGREMHVNIVQIGALETESFVGGSTLVDMYVKCGHLLDAKDVFDKLCVRDEASWMALMSGYSDQRAIEETFRCFEQMKRESISPGTMTLVCILRACHNHCCAETGRKIHCEVIKRGLESDVLIGNALLEMYSKFGFLEESLKVFNRIQEQDVVSWTLMISGYYEYGDSMHAWDCFEQMQLEGVSPSCATFTSILKVCLSIPAIQKGYDVHSEIVEKGLETPALLGNALVDMYVKRGLLFEARDVFDKFQFRTIISWNTLISGYAEAGKSQEAINCYERMHDEEDNLTPDMVTLSCCLKSCGSIGAIEKGQEVYIEIVKKGLEIETIVGNTLVDMYIKCGLLAIAQTTFEQNPARDVVTWTVLIVGYVDHGHCEEALNRFELMEQENFTLGTVTFVCGLRACGILGASVKGREMHAAIVKKGLDNELIGTNTLLDMYAKCGLLLDAQEIFDKAEVQDLISWNALIGGYSQTGQSKYVFDIFCRMVAEGVSPNTITFVSVLNVCSHEGLLEWGKVYFDFIFDYSCSIAVPEHFTCIIDLLGRAGCIEKALAVVTKMPFRPSSIIWHSVLGACQKWGDMELARHVFDHAILEDVMDTAAYVSMSNIYIHDSLHMCR